MIGKELKKTTIDPSILKILCHQDHPVFKENKHTIVLNGAKN